MAIDVRNAASSCCHSLTLVCQVSAAMRGDSQWTLNSLEVYMVSAAANANLTVSGAGSQLLTQEPGSTVKHINWQVATCLTTGTYNVRDRPRPSYLH